MKKCIYKRLAVLSLAAIMTMSLPMASMAENPQFAHDEATWARLRDNILEYDELEMLVEEYNKTYLTNQTNYLNTRETQTAEDVRDVQFDTAQDLYDSADDFRDQAEGMKDLIELMTGLYSGAIPPQAAGSILGAMGGMGGSSGGSSGGMGGSPADTIKTLTSAYTGLMMAANMTEQSAVKQEASAGEAYESSEMRELNYIAGQKGIVRQTQGLFAAYKTALTGVQTIESNIGILQQTAEFTERQRALGMATDLDVLTAQSNLQSLQSTLTSVQASVEKARQNLLVATGWNYNDNPEILNLPAANIERLAAMNLDLDTQTAMAANYTLKYDKMALSNMTSGSAGYSNMERTIASQESAIKTGMITLYNDVNQKKLALDLANAALAADNNSMRATEAKWQLGMIGKLEYLSAQATHIGKLADVQTADMALQQAIEAYEWALKGII